MLQITQDTPQELIIHIQNHEPIELKDFATSMNALACEYEQKHKGEVKLLIKEIRQGSIIATLITAGVAVLPFAEHANTILDFGNHLMNILSYLKGDKASSQPPLTQQSLTNIHKFVEPVAKDGGSIVQVEGNNNMIIINSAEAKEIQRNAQLELSRLNAPMTGTHKKALLYFNQTRADNKHGGDKGVIEAISPKEVKVIFDTPELKNRIIRESDKVYDNAYIVDVNVQTIKDKPALYTVMDFYEIVPLND
ncbi:hypothetical protein LU276_03865 [Moraxella haemolytica]|uniref:hypothetical protein n=1 Tax=Moraxella haemolytica TaxID=2904119 RepID=UPI0025439480|nr:hypothetical protein [Moraxella sp. ZY171148]WII95959.1 hypothetical protein LU276_03865 [Moraxella sp. ZY171148]